MGWAEYKVTTNSTSGTDFTSLSEVQRQLLEDYAKFRAGLVGRGLDSSRFATVGEAINIDTSFAKGTVRVMDEHSPEVNRIFDELREEVEQELQTL